MKLWLLRATHDKTDTYENASSPWVPWYDKAFGFVVRAETEDDARAIAAVECGDEGGVAWRTLATCVPLEPDGDPEMILRDYASA